MDRRTFTALAATSLWTATPALARKAPSLQREFAALERSVDGRLGVAWLDTATGRLTGHRTAERFPMCSTFKWLLAATVLQRVDEGRERLDREVPVTAADLVEYAPVVEPRVGQTLSVGALCDATVTLSDNAAANLLLADLGGPAAVTAWARSVGDRVTRLDRNEPTMNDVPPGDPRDTTTPAAMVATLRAALLGTKLMPASRDQLKAWMLATKTSDKRLRAHLPTGWQLADKTGTGPRGSTNDVGMVWAPGRAPCAVAVYLTDSTAPLAEREAVIAGVSRLLWERG